jgi:hypothetical protein
MTQIGYTNSKIAIERAKSKEWRAHRDVAARFAEQPQLPIEAIITIL